MRIWRLLGGLGSLLFGVPVIATWTHSGVPPQFQWLSLIILALTLIRPWWGLLAVAFLCPFTAQLHQRAEAAVSALAIAEIVLAPFLLAAGVRFAAGLRTPPGRLARPALVLGVIIACSAVVGLAAVQQITNWPLEYVAEFGRHLRTSYFDESPEMPFMPFHIAVVWIEGLTLAVFTERLLRANPRGWPSLLIAGGTVAAATAWVRLAEIAGRSGIDAAIRIVVSVESRVNTLFTDVNATGSLFALYLVPAVWLAWTSLRGRDGRRWLDAAGYAFASVVVALALWLTVSRAAHAGVVVGLVVISFASQRLSRTTIALGLAGAAAVIAAAVVLNSGSQSQSSPSLSAIIRWEMSRVALKVTEQHPVVGVGLGEFRRESRSFISPELKEIFPAARAGENAHNNFLQILAELGVIGFAGFLWLLAAGARSFPTAAATSDTADASRALTGGVLAFLVSALAGHPFLTTEVLWTFCLVLGAAAGLGTAPAASMGAAPWPRRIATVAACAILASVPVRLWQIRYQSLHFNYVGAGRLVRDIGGVAHRQAEARSLWWIPNDWRLLELPLRVTGDSALPCHVRVKIDGRPANVITLGPIWTTTTIQLSPRSGRPSRSVELEVDRPDCHLLVGEMATRE